MSSETDKLIGALEKNSGAWYVSQKENSCEFPEELTKQDLIDAGFKLIEADVSGGIRPRDRVLWKKWKTYEIEIRGVAFDTKKTIDLPCSRLYTQINWVILKCLADKEQRKHYKFDNLKICDS